MRLEDPEYTAPVIAKVPPPPKVRVNQVGYFPGLAKRAVLVNASPAPLAWELLNVAGTVVEKGMTVFSGPDVASGETVHFADFSAFKQQGSGYKLRVGGDESPRSPSVASSTRSSSTMLWRISITTGAVSRSPCPSPGKRSGLARPGT